MPIVSAEAYCERLYERQHGVDNVFSVLSYGCDIRVVNM